MSKVVSQDMDKATVCRLLVEALPILPGRHALVTIDGDIFVTAHAVDAEHMNQLFGSFERFMFFNDEIVEFGCGLRISAFQDFSLFLNLHTFTVHVRDRVGD